ncbi:hypothetical protein [Mangrovimonas sp. YM274]|uniref:hypothetical protein n=1 Tax=Mangrovimonas sp. YM274 TaxID=3070660 RepID=UPI0027DD0DFF|nr:hypothetical protein [Mangrovimonas sp. YM274]WMI69166.1 hypothetical protein RBH95_02055 [Mangrovimonas sp. YM274]
MILKKMLFVALLTVSVTGFGQIVNTNIDNYKTFKEGTTYFVKSEDESLNTYMIEFLADYWTVNPYKIIDASELDATVGEHAYFVNFLEHHYENRSRTSAQEYTLLQLTMFRELTEAKKKGKKRYPRDVLGTVELKYVEPKEKWDITPAELRYAIRLLNNQIDFVFEMNISKDLNFKDFLDVVNEKKKAIVKEKTWYLNDEALKSKVNSAEKIKKLYSYPFELKSEEEIDAAVFNQEANVVYGKMIRLRTLYFYLLIDAETSELLYGRVTSGMFLDLVGPKFLRDVNE